MTTRASNSVLNLVDPPIDELILVTPLATPSGGTGVKTMPVGGVVIGQGINAVSFATPNTLGYPLVSQGPGVSPQFSDSISINFLTINNQVINILTSDAFYYISLSGSDVTGDGSAPKPWATLLKAYEVVSSTTNFGPFTVHLIVGSGTYTSFGTAFAAATGNWIIEGASGLQHSGDVDGGLSHSGDVLIHVTGSNASCFGTSGNADVKLAWMTVQADDGAGIAATGASHIDSFEVNFNGGITSNCLHTNANDGGTITFTGNYVINGGAVWHYFASGGKITASSGFTPTIVTSSIPVTFSSAFAGVSDGGFLRAVSGTFSGVSVTGTSKRFIINSNSTVDAGFADPATFFPGNVAGTQTSNGVDNSGLWIISCYSEDDPVMQKFAQPDVMGNVGIMRICKQAIL